MRYDIISDTHGHLSPELLRALEGADFIVHAGDICSGSDWRTLCGLADEVHACLGNNDFANSYGPFVTKLSRFYSEGLRWEICHYRERLDLETCEPPTSPTKAAASPGDATAPPPTPPAIPSNTVPPASWGS